MKTPTYIRNIVRTSNARNGGFLIVGCVGGCDTDDLTAQQLVRLGYLTKGQPIPEVCRKCFRYNFTAEGIKLIEKYRSQRKVTE